MKSNEKPVMRILLFVNLNLETSHSYISVTDLDRIYWLQTNQTVDDNVSIKWVHKPQRAHLVLVTKQTQANLGPIKQIVTFHWSNQTDFYFSFFQSDRLLHFIGSIRQIVAYRYDWIGQIVTYFEQGFVIWSNRASCNIPRSPPRSETLTSGVSAGEITVPVSQVCNSFISHQISVIVLTRCLPFCSTEPTYLTLLLSWCVFLIVYLSWQGTCFWM